LKFKKPIHTISALTGGAYAGNAIKDGIEYSATSVIGIVALILALLTLDWSKSLEEKKTEVDHLTEDGEILKRQLENERIQQELRRIRNEE